MPGILTSKPFESGDKSPHSKENGSLELVFQQTPKGGTPNFDSEAHKELSA